MQTLLTPTGIRRAVAACGLATSFVLASQAHADDWGCTVLLCLANPSGPMAVSECVGPINKLWKHLASFHPFPTCTMVGAPGTGANQVSDHFDVCPEGTSPLALGELAYQGPGKPAEGAYFSDKSAFVVGRGDSMGMEKLGKSFKFDKSDKICVADKVGSVAINLFDPGISEYSPATVSVYNTIVKLPWQSSPNVIDVYIEGKLHNRVRW